MGVELMHQAWQCGAGKFIALGTVCAYPKFTPVPFHEDDCGMVIRRNQSPYGLAKKMLAGSGTSLPSQQYGIRHFSAAG